MPERLAFEDRDTDGASDPFLGPEQVVTVGERWQAAREARAETLRRIEGTAAFRAHQRFDEVACRLARERRLSRFVYLAET